MKIPNICNLIGEQTNFEIVEHVLVSTLNDFKLMAITGRQRVGKTTLTTGLIEHMGNYDNIYAQNTIATDMRLSYPNCNIVPIDVSKRDSIGSETSSNILLLDDTGVTYAVRSRLLFVCPTIFAFHKRIDMDALSFLAKEGMCSVETLIGMGCINVHLAILSSGEPVVESISKMIGDGSMEELVVYDCEAKSYELIRPLE